MKTLNLGLLFFDEGLNGSNARVWVQFSATHTRGDNEYRIISPECLSAEEFDAELDRLHRELEIIRKQAATKFHKAA